MPELPEIVEALNIMENLPFQEFGALEYWQQRNRLRNEY